MNLTEKILEYALNHFDVVGACPISTNESYLILGLESTPKRNLDEFKKTNNKLAMKGIAVYVQPGLEAIINRLKELDVLATPIGKHGYPSRHASPGKTQQCSHCQAQQLPDGHKRTSCSATALLPWQQHWQARQLPQAFLF